MATILKYVEVIGLPFKGVLEDGKVVIVQYPPTEKGERPEAGLLQWCKGYWGSKVNVPFRQKSTCHSCVLPVIPQWGWTWLQ